jgi:signal transduction histidine kinase
MSNDAGSVKPRILIIDDEEVDRELVERMIRSAYSVEHASSARAGLERLRSEAYACILLDYRLPDSAGLEVLAQLVSEFEGGIVMLTGEGSETIAASAIQAGAHDYLVKGSLTPELLPRVIQNACAKASHLRAQQKQQEEFRHFAFTAAHDLRAPFRRIRTLCEMLDTSTGTPGEKHELIVRIQHSAAELESLIEGLLNYARVGHPENVTDISLSHAYRQACVNLQGIIDEKHATLVCDKLPSVKGDPLGMLLLFQNLIGNALKFNTNVPCVYVRATSTSTDWILSIEDNGIGIDPVKSEVLFKPFERLHGRGQYEGLGLGLATCRRIVEAHGGTISVDSEPGKGSRFVVTLPREAGQDGPAPREAVSDAIRSGR